MNKNFLIEKYFKFPFDDISKLINLNDSFWTFDFNKISLSLSLDRTQVHISERTVQYTCQADIGKIDSNKDNTIIICIRDNNSLLKFCLDKIYKNHINEYCDIIVVDDRSISNDNYLLCLQKQITCIRLKNTDNDFNYSLINNIAASYAYVFGKKRLWFWNSDLWSDNPSAPQKILDAHISNNSSITGTRLIYPDQSAYKQLDTKEHVLGNTLSHSYNTIQHGGIIFIPSPYIVNQNQSIFMPAHQWRFYPKQHDLASVNQRCIAVTGALHIVNTKDFLALGGYACCLGTSYQDIDLCLRAVQKNLSVYYVGSEFLIHAETITNEDGKKHQTSLSHQSDRIIYEYVWQNQMLQLLGMKK
jgi:hypothetical protein